MKSLVSTENNNSSKRAIGLIGMLSLIVAMFIFHTADLYYCVAGLSGSALAITGAEKIFNNKPK
jgi:hypothetical protein